jgi:GGDEF domain-containing protein
LATDLLKPPKADSLPEEATLLADVEDLAAAVARVTSRTRMAHAAAEPTGPRADFSAAGTAPSPAVPDRTTHGARPASGGSLTERLEAALAACRKRRVPLSVVLVEIDRFEAVARTVGPIIAEQWVRRVGLLCEACDLPGAQAVQSAAAGFALILPGCDRGEAVAVAVDVLVRFREATQRPGSPNVIGLSASVGVSTAASPAKNFRVSDLLDSANRCLSTAQLSGGNSLKSIGMY